MSLFQVVEIEMLYTEVSSFQGVVIEEFHCIQRCPHFREKGSAVYCIYIIHIYIVCYLSDESDDDIDK